MQEGMSLLLFVVYAAAGVVPGVMTTAIELLIA